jgi:chaperone required for assembly of F1-ATPase
MSGWKAKRFWKQATVVAEGAGWGVRLDGRPVRTPAKAALVVPTRAMAEAIAAEWDAQQGEVRPATMPAMRAANSAIDTVSVQFDAVARMIAAYGKTDLLCYRAEGPGPLADRQAAVWDPLLDWAAEVLGARLVVTTGVLPVAQDVVALSRLEAALRGCTAFELAALHDLVAIPGSLVVGLAVARGHIGVEDGWTASRIDETWQAEQWGVDEEAAAQEALKRQAMHDAARFLALARAD